MFRLFSRKQPSPWIIVGLGNYGPKYAHTRHNAGFDAVEVIAKKLGIQISKRRCQSLTAEGSVNHTRILLAQPQTYMNNSGQAVSALLRFYHTDDLSRLIVIYDDIDLPLAAVRVRPSGSAGTHNGMRSILAHLHGQQDFPRIRVGIGRPEKGELVDFVTGTYSQEQKKLILPAIEQAAEAALSIVMDGVEASMRQYNKKHRLSSDLEGLPRLT